jgi:hypothetical protein
VSPKELCNPLVEAPDARVGQHLQRSFIQPLDLFQAKAFIRLDQDSLTK